MYFSEYVVSERVSSFLDPLGFMRPAGVLSEKLFEQFTVLSNHPGYHGVLCAILKFLSEREPRQRMPLGRDFRRAEVLWGILNAMRKSAVINIRKYSRLVDGEETIRLDELPANHPLYARLGYGTLGHYSQPSISWGLLEKDGRQLTVKGQSLAAAARLRGEIDLTDWLSRWMDGHELTFKELEVVADHFHLGALPHADERREWRKLIDAWKFSRPVTRSLWDSPVEFSNLVAAETDADQHHQFITGLPEKYPSLASPLRAVADFEVLSGFVQFVFDLRLARLQYASAGIEDLSNALKKEIAQVIIERARDSVLVAEPRLDASGLFARLASSAPAYDALERIVCEHHVAHQRAKGVSPFFDGEQLLLRDKVDRAELGAFTESVAQARSAEAALRMLGFRSRRDWHFGRCRRYYDFAHGGKQA